MSDLTDLLQTYAATPSPTDPGATAPSSSKPWWVQWLHAIFGPGGVLPHPPIDARPPVSVDPQGVPHKVPSTIGSDVPNSVAGPSSLGDIGGQIGGAISGSFSGLGKSLTDAVTGAEHSAEVGGVFLLLALLFVGSLFIFLTSKSQ